MNLTGKKRESRHTCKEIRIVPFVSQECKRSVEPDKLSDSLGLSLSCGFSQLSSFLWASLSSFVNFKSTLACCEKLLR